MNGSNGSYLTLSPSELEMTSSSPVGYFDLTMSDGSVDLVMEDSAGNVARLSTTTGLSLVPGMAAAMPPISTLSN